MALTPAIRTSSRATLAGLLFHYLAFYVFGAPLWTETIAEWIMAHTPSYLAVPILQTLGPLAKPFAVTGALATLGFAVFVTLPLRWIGPLVAAAALGTAFHYQSWTGQLSFWIPVAIATAPRFLATPYASSAPARRSFLTSSLMSIGVVGVALESYVRNQALARRALEPAALFPFEPPPEKFHPALVRKAVTPVPEFYGMSKNTVDPLIDAHSWRLRLTANGRTLREIGYSELLALPRLERYVTLRCVSNTLKSDLMGTAAWSGIRLSQLVDPGSLPPGILEAAFLGIDGHGDSLPLDYAFSDEVLLALGMNGKTLDRTHGFPIRLLAPRYYGFKNVKWFSEIAFVTKPYYGTWPKMGYTKEPVIHIASHIDRIERTPAGLCVAGVSFAGTRGIQEVRIRAGAGPWVAAILDQPLSPYTWTRWYGTLPAADAAFVEAQARDGAGRWQEAVEGPLFPDGVTGPTIRRVG